MLRASGLNEKDRQILLTQEYPLLENAEDDSYADFEYSVIETDNGIELETVFNYAKDIEELTFGSIISITAHEALHSVQIKNFYEQHKTEPFKRNGIIAGAVTTSAMLLSGLFMNEGLAYIIPGGVMGTGIGYSFYKTQEHLTDFNDEKYANRHEGMFEYMFDKSKTPLEKIEQEKQRLEKKVSLFSRIKDCLISGYPSEDLSDLFCAEGQEIAAKNNMRYNSTYMSLVKRNTKQNIADQRFNIYNLEP